MPKAAGFRGIRAFSLTGSRCWRKPPATRRAVSSFRFWGGFEGAERQVLCIEPPDAWQEEPIAYLRMQTYDSGDKLPTHRDYLGSILGLGLERSCVGDLLADTEKRDTHFTLLFWQISRNL